MIKFKPSHPGRVLKKNYLEPLSLSVTEAAKGLRVTRQNLSEIVNEQRAISPEMALRLSESFNTTPDFWLNMQKNYDLWHVQKNRSPIDVEPFFERHPV